MTKMRVGGEGHKRLSGGSDVSTDSTEKWKQARGRMGMRKVLWTDQKALQSHGGMIRKPVEGDNWVLVGKGPCEKKMGNIGVVKNLIGHHLDSEAEPLRSGQRSWGGGQATHDQIGTLE